jgi:hypothetical protein
MHSGWSKTRVGLLLGFAGAAGSLAAGNLLYFLLAAAWMLFMTGLGNRRPTWSVTSFTLAGVLAVLGFFGLWFERKYPPPAAQDIFEPANWARPHDVLGNQPFPGLHARWKRYVGGKLLFDVAVSTDENGLRITPPAPQAKESILFFGCSYTFGHGVNDSETFPYLVGAATAGKYAVYNFGFNGYGPNQMLAALQSGWAETVVRQPPILVVYLAIPDHVRRVWGRELPIWQMRDPRFELDANGRLVRTGRFEDRKPDEQEKRLTQRILNLYEKSYFKKIAPTTTTDYRLYVEIVKASRDEVARRFPRSHFEVVYWPPPDPGAASWAKGTEDTLRAAGFEVHNVKTFLRGDAYKYVLSPKDVHPNPVGDQLMADYVVEALIPRDN